MDVHHELRTRNVCSQLMRNESHRSFHHALSSQIFTPLPSSILGRSTPRERDSDSSVDLEEDDDNFEIDINDVDDDSLHSRKRLHEGADPSSPSRGVEAASASASSQHLVVDEAYRPEDLTKNERIRREYPPSIPEGVGIEPMKRDYALPTSESVVNDLMRDQNGSEEGINHASPPSRSAGHQILDYSNFRSK